MRVAGLGTPAGTVSPLSTISNVAPFSVGLRAAPRLRPPLLRIRGHAARVFLPTKDEGELALFPARRATESVTLVAQNDATAGKIGVPLAEFLFRKACSARLAFHSVRSTTGTRAEVRLFEKRDVRVTVSVAVAHAGHIPLLYAVIAAFFASAIIPGERDRTVGRLRMERAVLFHRNPGRAGQTSSGHRLTTHSRCPAKIWVLEETHIDQAVPDHVAFAHDCELCARVTILAARLPVAIIADGAADRFGIASAVLLRGEPGFARETFCT